MVVLHHERHNRQNVGWQKQICSAGNAQPLHREQNVERNQKCECPQIGTVAQRTKICGRIPHQKVAASR